MAALMLLVVIEVARRSSVAPSRLPMPLAYGWLFGGLMTLIGKASNLLVRVVFAVTAVRLPLVWPLV